MNDPLVWALKSDFHATESWQKVVSAKVGVSAKAGSNVSETQQNRDT